MKTLILIGCFYALLLTEKSYSQTNYVVYDGSFNVAVGNEPLSLISTTPAGVTSTSPATLYSACLNYASCKPDDFALSYQSAATFTAAALASPNTAKTSVGFVMTNNSGGPIPITMISVNVQRYSNAGTPSNIQIFFRINGGAWWGQNAAIPSSTGGCVWSAGTVNWNIGQIINLQNTETFEVRIHVYGGSVWCDHYEVMLDRITVSDMVILPNELVNFAAYENDNNEVNIEWSTATESNSSQFIIERSTDGVLFSSIGTIPASGTSNENKFYSFKDTDSPDKAEFYYRLKSVDVNGNYKYSSISTLNRLLYSDENLIIYPNPVQTELKLKTSENADVKAIYVYDMDGKIIRFDPSFFSDETSLDVSELKEGLYYLVMETTNNRITKTFIKY